MQSSHSSSSQSIQPVQPQSLNHADFGGHILPGLLFIILPSFLFMGVFLGKKYYCRYRANMLKQRIELLEKIWHMSPKQ